MTSKRKANVSSILANSNDLGSRWKSLLREQAYPGPHKAKRIQGDWGVSLGLAKVWLAGGKPTSDQIVRARVMWGDTVIEALFGQKPQSLAERLAAVEQEVAAIKSGQQEKAHDQDHIGAHGSLPRMAGREQHAHSQMVAADQGPLAPDKLSLAHDAELTRRSELPR